MRLSVLHLIFACIATAAFVVFIFAKWDGKNERIQILNREILAMQARIEKADRMGNRALAYARIVKGLDIIAGRRISDEQKNLLADKLFAISSDYKIDPLLILAVIKHESKGDPNAKGTYMSGKKSGALGLMQIKYESAAEAARSVGIKISSPDDLMKPEINLMIGTAYLLRLIAKYQDLQHALIAYNIGFGTLDGKLRREEDLPTKYYNGIMREYRFLAEGIFYFPSIRGISVD